MWDNLSKRERVLLIILLIVIIVVPYYFFIYEPYQQKITDYQQQLSSKERELAITRVYVKKLPDEKKKLEELQEATKVLVESDYSSEGILDFFLRVTEKYNLKLVSYSPVERNNEITINGLLEGEFDNLIAFLEDFENTYRDFTYNDLNMRPQSGLVQLQINCTYKEELESGGDLT